VDIGVGLFVIVGNFTRQAAIQRSELKTSVNSLGRLPGSIGIFDLVEGNTSRNIEAIATKRIVSCLGHPIQNRQSAYIIVSNLSVAQANPQHIEDGLVLHKGLFTNHPRSSQRVKGSPFLSHREIARTIAPQRTAEVVFPVEGIG